MKYTLFSLGFFMVVIIGLSSLMGVADPIELDNPDCLDSLNVPERFTPNADKIDDVFEVKFPCQPESFEIHVSNRFGVEVFHSKKYNFVWYGTNLKNKPCESGIYDWKIEYTYQMKYVEVSG